MTSLSDFTYGFAPQPIIPGLKAAVVTQNDLSHNLQRLKADGYTHYEINEGILTNGISPLRVHRRTTPRGTPPPTRRTPFLPLTPSPPARILFNLFPGRIPWLLTRFGVILDPCGTRAAPPNA
jgi:hypothetical protein